MSQKTEHRDGIPSADIRMTHKDVYEFCVRVVAGRLVLRCHWWL